VGQTQKLIQEKIKAKVMIGQQIIRAGQTGRGLFNRWSYLFWSSHSSKKNPIIIQVGYASGRLLEGAPEPP
jgi:hypothetical protein